jgi:uncharacterized protein
MLEQLKPELAQKFHIKSAGLFGSVIRNDFSSNNDIDIIEDFNQPIGIEFIGFKPYGLLKKFAPAFLQQNF